jgi:thymidylate kinase
MFRDADFFNSAQTHQALVLARLFECGETTLTNFPVIVVDGPDGAGKTTLVHTLHKLYLDRQTVLTAPRLGQFLPCGDVASQFAAWITARPTEEVNRTMMFASFNRMAEVANLANSGMVLVDRGPVTAFASCIARTVIKYGVSVREAEGVLAPLIEQFRLYPFSNGLLFHILCYVPADVILERCAKEVENQEYYGYLTTLHAVLRPTWPLLRNHLVLPANVPPETNARTVIERCAS